MTWSSYFVIWDMYLLWFMTGGAFWQVEGQQLGLTAPQVLLYKAVQ